MADRFRPPLAATGPGDTMFANILLPLGGSERAKEALPHVEALARQVKAKGIEAKAEVAFGRPAGGILRYAQSNKIDLIVMSTHGEGGPDPYAYGPTTGRGARRAPCPVMLIRPAEVRELLPLPK